MTGRTRYPMSSAIAGLVLAVALLDALGSPPLYATTYRGLQARLPVVLVYGERGNAECSRAWKVLEETRQESWDRVRICFVNVRWHRRTATRVGVTTLPTILFLTHGGREVSRHQGPMTRKEVDAAIAEVVARDGARPHVRHPGSRAGCEARDPRLVTPAVDP